MAAEGGKLESYIAALHAGRELWINRTEVPIPQFIDDIPAHKPQLFFMNH